MDKLTSLRVFCRVLESNSFAQAARDLGLSAGMVSKHVARLEGELGTRLLNRTTRRVNATEAGRGYYRRAQQILRALDEAEEEISALGETPRGWLKVSMPLDFGLSYLAPLVADFLAAQPQMSLEAIYEDRTVDLVSEGFDLAVRVGSMPDSSLIGRKLAEDRDIVCASPDYLRLHGTPQHPGELREHAHLSYHYWPGNDSYTFHGPDGQISVYWRSRLRANNGSSLVAAAVRGLGIIALPTFIVGDALRRGELVQILPDYRMETISIYALYPHRTLVSAKLRAFVDFLAARLGGSDYSLRASAEATGGSTSGCGAAMP